MIAVSFTVNLTALVIAGAGLIVVLRRSRRRWLIDPEFDERDGEAFWEGS